MTWFKVQDTILTDPKMLMRSPEAFRSYFLGLAFCSQQLSNGVIPAAMLPVIHADDAICDELVAEGLWEWDDDGTTVLVANYLKHQRSKAQVEREREATRLRAERKRKRDRNGESNGVTNGGSAVAEESRAEENPPKAPRPSDVMVSALADGVGAWSRKQKASAKLREAATELARRGVEPTDIPTFFERWHIAFPDATPPTDPAKVVTHWTTVMDAKVSTLDSRRATARPAGQGPDCATCRDAGFILDDDTDAAVQCPDCKRGLD